MTLPCKIFICRLWLHPHTSLAQTAPALLQTCITVSLSLIGVGRTTFCIPTRSNSLYIKAKSSSDMYMGNIYMQNKEQVTNALYSILQNLPLKKVQIFTMYIWYKRKVHTNIFSHLHSQHPHSAAPAKHVPSHSLALASFPGSPTSARVSPDHTSIYMYM